MDRALARSRTRILERINNSHLYPYLCINTPITAAAAARSAAAARCEVTAVCMPSFQVGHRAGLERSSSVRWQAWPGLQHRSSNTNEDEAGVENRGCFCCCSFCFCSCLSLLLLLAAANARYVRVPSSDRSRGTAVYSAAVAAVATLLFAVFITESSRLCSPRSRPHYVLVFLRVVVGYTGPPNSPAHCGKTGLYRRF